ncbi:hypothetical protein BGX34_000192 [Mortierella sp. NVP85]|nr:hypothetical protein BGX34_000192 [Mortierella sp. NVP85]
MSQESPVIPSVYQPTTGADLDNGAKTRAERCGGEEIIQELNVREAGEDALKEPIVTASYTFSGGARTGLAATAGGGMEATSSNFSAHGSQSVSSQDQGAQPAFEGLGVTLSESSLNDNINCEEDDNDNDEGKGQYRTTITFGARRKTHEQAKRGSLASVSTLASRTSSAAPEERGTDNGEGGVLPRLFLGPGVLGLHGPDSPSLDDDDNGNGYGEDIEGVIDPGAFSSASSSPPSSPLTYSSRGSSNSVSPVSSRQQRPRPHSQFPTGRLLFHNLHSRPWPGLSNIDDNSLFMDRNVPLRRANSLPASRRSHNSVIRTTQVPTLPSVQTPLLPGSVASTIARESQGDKSTAVEPNEHQQLPQRYFEGMGASGDDHTQHFTRPQSIIVNAGPSLEKTSVNDLSVPPKATAIPPVVGSDGAPTGSVLAQLETNRATTGRPRRQSLLSPRQLQIMGQQQQHQLQHGNEAATFRVSAQSKAQTSTPGSGGTSSRRGVLTNFIKDHGKKQKDKSRSGESSGAPPTTATESKRSQKNKQPPHQQLKPSVKNMPSITFLPHSTEISVRRPSVSGRLLLHIPRLDGYKFHFVSLKLYLRLKESISWIRQDLVSFEIEKHHWGQTVWEKKMTLEFEDKQVDEKDDSVLGTEETAAVLEQGQLRGPSPVTASLDPNLSSSTTTTSQDHSNTPLGAAATSLPGTKSDTPVMITSDPADEWYWEWFVPVTKQEARPESFEGSMGSVWYELEAKCLFRWDCVDKDGNVIFPGSDLQSQSQTHESSVGAKASPSLPSKAADVSQGKNQSGPSLLQKGLGVFGKLVGGKSKKPQYAGDFKMPSQHEEYIKDSLRKADTRAPAQDSSHKPPSYTSIFALAFGKDTEPQEQSSTPHQGPPIPFQIRKSLKLYFTRPLPEISPNPAISLPPPSQPALPGTRRLKAIIPGARIQVQIQVPSMVPIPGYVHTSQLVPCSKTGVLILNKIPSGISSATATKLPGGCHGHIQASGNAIITGAHPEESYVRPRLEDNMRYPDDFQAVLTVRRVTQHDIKKCDILRRRYENAEAVANAANQHANIPPTSSTPHGPYMLKRLLSHQSSSSYTSGPDAAEEPSDISGFTASGSSDSGQRSTGQDRVWRRDIRVRKVKCEFWQRENCRIPSADTPSRSIKTSLGPVFTYTEKDIEKERQRSTNTSQQQQQQQQQQQPLQRQQKQKTTGFDVSVSPGTEGSHSPVAALGVRMEMSPNLSGTSDTGSLVPPSRSGGAGRKDSMESSIGSPLLQPTQPLPKPFKLSIPVPLDSPKIRQTYSWPSLEALSGYECSESRDMPTNSSGAGYNSEMDCQPQATGYEVSNGGSFSRRDDSGIVGGYKKSSLNHPPSASTVKARIEVKHYLTFRLSIDVLEYEGEPEHEDLDLEAVEERQLLRVRSQQELSSGLVGNVSGGHDHYHHIPPKQATTSTPSSTTALRHLYNAKASPPASPTSESAPTPNQINETGQPSPLIPTALSTAGSAPRWPLGESGYIDHSPSQPVASGVGDDGASPDIKPAFAALSSTADMLGTDVEMGASPSMTYDLSKRRGSRSSEATTVKSGNSGNSGSTRSGGNVHTTPTSLSGGSSYMGSSSVSIAPIADHGVKGTGYSGASRIAGAFGVLRKKGSNSGLAKTPPQKHIQQPLQQYQKRTSRVNVQKLKDFVIRVPITVVIQADEHGQILGMSGCVNNSSECLNDASIGTEGLPSNGVETSFANSVSASVVKSMEDPMSSLSPSSLLLPGSKYLSPLGYRLGGNKTEMRHEDEEEEEVVGQFVAVDAEDDE